VWALNVGPFNTPNFKKGTVEGMFCYLLLEAMRRETSSFRSFQVNHSRHITILFAHLI